MNRKILWVNANGIGLSVAKSGNAILDAYPKNLYDLWHNYKHFALNLSTTDALSDITKNPELAYVAADSGHIWPSGEEIVRKNLSDLYDLTLNPLMSNLINELKFHNGALHFVVPYGQDGEYKNLTQIVEFLKKFRKNGIFLCYFHFIIYQKISPKIKRSLLDFEEQLKNINIGEIISISYTAKLFDFNTKEEILKKISRLIYLADGKKSFSPKEALKSLENAANKDHFLSILNHGLSNPSINDFDSVFFANHFFLNLERFVDRLISKEAKFFQHKPKQISYFSFLEPPFPTYVEISGIFKRPEYLSLNGILSQNKIKRGLLTSTANMPRVKVFFGKNIVFDDEISYDPRTSYSTASYPDIFKRQLKRLIQKNGFVFVDLCEIENSAISGDYKRTISEIKKIDKIFGTLEQLSAEATVILTSLYGIAEKMSSISLTANSRARVTTNPLPFIIIGEEFKAKSKTSPSLANLVSANKCNLSLAPTVLSLLNIEKPKQMTEKSLI